MIVVFFNRNPRKWR